LGEEVAWSPPVRKVVGKRALGPGEEGRKSLGLREAMIEGP
jgi:hypothetical protein